MAAKKATKKSAPTFEQSLGELEALVEAMENDQLPLEELVDHYEKGAVLLQHCEKVLAAARKRIELIEVSPSPEKELAPGPSADEDQGSRDGTETADDVDDDIRLF